MNKMVHGGKTLLQTKADRAKGDAVRESDIPDDNDEDDHEDGDGALVGGKDNYDDEDDRW